MKFVIEYQNEKIKIIEAESVSAAEKQMKKEKIKWDDIKRFDMLIER